uniref:Uncharacterized protein n=2 Tax=Zea mays TaxID=4577 RepID=A0A804NQ72_MAIZE
MVIANADDSRVVLPQPTTAPSRHPAHHPPEAQPATDSEMALDKVWEMVRNCRLDSTVRKVKMEHVIPNNRNRVNDMSSMSTPTMD